MSDVKIDMKSARRESGLGYIAPALSLAIACVAALHIWYSYERAESQVARETRADAHVAAIYVREVFASATLALQSLDAVTGRTSLVVRGTPNDLHVAMARAQGIAPMLNGMSFMDADGRVVANSTSAAPPPTDRSDRPYFRYLRETRDYALQIDPPTIARPRGAVGIPVALRAESETGEFAGVVGALIDPGRFAQFFASLDSTIVSIADKDGNLYARNPPVPLVGAKARVQPPLDDGEPVHYTASTEDGQTRLVASERIDGTPLYVLASVPYATVVEAWLGHSVGTALVAVLAISLVFLASALVRRRLRETAARVAVQAAREEAAREDADHFRTVARNKSDFLAHMSHEIRTPINAIVGFADVIASDAMKLGAPQRYREYAADIRFSADHLLGIINRILDMSKIESGRWKLALGPVEPARVVSETRHLAQQRAAKEGVRIETDVSGGSVEFVADERVVVQILLNLTINAIKFAGEDRLVRLGCRAAAGDRVEFWVADAGRGMTAEEARRALEPFETAGDGDVRSDTGLGLPLSLMFARLHGGTLEIETAPGKGTRVRVLLPRRGPQAAANAA